MNRQRLISSYQCTSSTRSGANEANEANTFALPSGRRLSRPPVAALCALIAAGFSLAGASPVQAQTRTSVGTVATNTTTLSDTNTAVAVGDNHAGAFAADIGVVEPPKDADGFQNPLPPGPEGNAGCSVPTLHMCQDQSYLTTYCGQLQLENAWTCSGLIQNEYFDTPSIIAYEISPTGVSYVIPGGSAEQDAEYFADPGSIGSGYAAAEHGGSVPGLVVHSGDITAADPYEVWANGTDFRSCQEYVYERYYEVHEFLRRLGADARDPYRVLEVAFGPETDPASFGTHHLTNLVVHALNGQATTSLYYGPEDKNMFFWLPPNLATTEIPDPGPGLHESLRVYSGLADGMLDKLEASRAIDNPGSLHYRTMVYPRNLDYDRWWWKKVLYDGYQAPGGNVGTMPDLMFNPNPGSGDNTNFVDVFDLTIQDDGIYTPEELLGLVPGYTSMRRYLRAELDELHEIQARVKALSQRWWELNWQYLDSGWSPEQIAGQGPGSITGAGGFITPEAPDPQTPGYTVPLPVGHPDPQGFNDYQALDTSEPPDREANPSPSRVPPRGMGQLAVPDSSETAQRRALLAELVELMRAGSVAGCLEPGITACDWSPREFRQRVLRSIDHQRELDYRSCQRVVDSIWQDSNQPPTNGLMMNMLNKTYLYDDSNGCTVSVPSSLTPSSLVSVREGIEGCREAQAQVAEETALAEISETSDLYDEATGEFRNPGFWKSGGERMGNDWFAVGYDYNFGWELDLSQGVCSAEAAAGAHFDAYVDLLKRFDGIYKKVKLVDLTAMLDTRPTNGGTLFELSAEVFGSPIFNPVTKEDGAPSNVLSFSAAREGSEGIEVGASVPFVIVFVPVSLGGGVAAEIGVRSTISGQAVGFGDNGQCPQVSLKGELEPFARARGFVTAAVELGVARAGFRGNVTLIEASFPFSPSFALATDLDADVQAGAVAADLKLIVETSASMRLSTLDGEISAFAEVGWPPIGVRGSLTIIDWNGPSWQQTLYKKTYELPLSTLTHAFGDG